MDKLDFVSLHEEKLILIFQNIKDLSDMKEFDTQLPPKFFAEAVNDVIADYKAKMSILSRNTKFVVKELKKDFRLLRREQKRIYAELRRKQRSERTEYIFPPELLHAQ